MNDKQRSTTTKAKTSAEGFTDAEKAAMKDRAKELKAEARASKSKAEGEQAILAKIAEMPQPDRGIAERIHAIVVASAPVLVPKTWYGMPAYANKDGKVVCFFQSADKFKARYATLGFNDAANLDEGKMWPTAFALTELTNVEEARIAELVKKCRELSVAPTTSAGMNLRRRPGCGTVRATSRHHCWRGRRVAPASTRQKRARLDRCRGMCPHV